MGTLLALASAVCYGLADFTGGLLARRGSFVIVALAGQVGGLALSLAFAPAVATAGPAASDLGWGALSGVGTGAGMLFLYRGLGRGAMSVVVPVSAVGGVTLPVLVGVVFLGDHPSALSSAGIALSVPALWLVSQTRRRAGPATATTPAAFDGLIAGTGIALQYLALAQAEPRAGLWPVVAGRVTAALGLLSLIVARRRSSGARGADAPGRRQLLLAAGPGGIAAMALTFYLAATRETLLVVAVVLSSLYPAIPVLLGITALRERLSWKQTLGLLGAAAAVGLLTIG
ncbi:EamA family transporter [Actinomadura sp. DC4]|uniref:EamA family transporter n=1 Tax=Actinomadura sp. DC4 TaxID=3055069 RepID=UPI0025B031E5|nr:EamA family transporter [Actinomadura sp. DC4]MDN3359662.1 EamA family transporter [Actinomadura sp. DC4]